MSPESLLKRLSETNTNAQALALGWEESRASLPSGPLPFLDPKNLLEWRAFCGIPDTADNPLSETAQTISSSPDLRLLAWHAYRRMYLMPDDNSLFKEWPELRNTLGDKAGLFYLVIALAMVPLVRAAHARLAVPPEVTKDTCRQVFHFTDTYRRDHPAEWGILRRQLYWLRHYPRAQLFRIGRFEYKLKLFDVETDSGPKPSDWVLDLHIPAGGGMSLEVCADSFRRAFEFFDCFFPEKRANAVVCQSWMFNPDLAKILPPDSNLVRLLNEVHLFPIPVHERDGFFFLFGSKGESAPLSELPRETSLQRAILDFVAKGNPWRGGGMYLLRTEKHGFLRKKE